jgi:hypothetical protein
VAGVCHKGKRLEAGGLQGASSDPLENWRNLYPLTDLANVRSVHHGDGLWLALANEGILSSHDAVNWRRVDTDFPVVDLEFANGKWIAAAGGGVPSVYESSDGETWTETTFGPDNFRINDMSFGSGKWVLQATSPGVNTQWFSSMDGKIWTNFQLSLSYHTALQFGDGQWLALGISNGVSIGSALLFGSTDGQNWTPRNLPAGIYDSPLARLVHNNRGWFLFNPSYVDDSWRFSVWKSADGMEWTKLGTSGPVEECFPQVTMLGERFLLTCKWGAAYLSDNGVDWIPTPHAAPVGSAAFGDGRWRGWTAQGQFVVSTDGFQWLPMPDPAAGGLPGTLDFAHGKWALLFSRESVSYLALSEDGNLWREQRLPVGVGNASQIRHTSQGWIIFGAGALLRSADAENWEVVPSQAGRALQLDYGNGRWVALFEMGELASSTNLVSWEQQSPPVDGSYLLYGGSIVTKLKFAGGIWIGLTTAWGYRGPNYRLVASDEGKNWMTVPTQPEIVDFAVGDSVLLVGKYGGIYLSDPLYSLASVSAGVFKLRRARGGAVTIESSEDLLNWNSAAAVEAGNSEVLWEDPRRPFIGSRFYRLRVP